MTRISTPQRTWLVTGASSGLGRALTETALAAGDTVVAAMRRPERIDDLLVEHAGSLLPIAFDVRDTQSAPAVVEAAIDRFGRVDVLVNNGGVGQIGSAEEVDDARLRDMLEQHVVGPAALTRAVLPGMRARGTGTIVQMSSQGGRISFPGVGSYSAGKFALEGWSEALAGEVAPFGIRVLIVEPSRFRTCFNSADVLERAAPVGVYADLLGEFRADMLAADGRQEGDPHRAALVIRQLVGAESVPLRLPLGREAVRRLREAYRRELASLETYAELSSSADFPGVPESVRPV
ncbi:short-chain dehydrogenase/reductase [Rhodococcus sp. 06-462-5]|uniref:SDR family NAD(P)-dependent oxidoreductase n=1 Tax=unclassified Rhodococcus (in: high G+C Gram-positive bacteria) TaxID=192944 RepID=UPI000B9B506C|nr:MULTISPECIES: SDR family NAD(P)-dependent oxidoreductase [unclassified Rhodococcus (in: high G+C Gram-positive bacteria)]OZC78690.1 short-chain dehydrogenase/reductase [Rhodococcus sp. 06-462-5]OZE63745.1 short-chain dehydrogenase/reductase [Rhodococcus sp. 02-925g]